MSLPAHTNNVGTFAKDRDFTYTYSIVDSDGGSGTAQYARRYRVAYSRKTATVKTHIRFINGTPWRDPTTYGRAVERYNYSPGTRQWSEPWKGNGWKQYTYNGISASNPHNLDHEMVRPTLGILNTSAYSQSVTEALLKLNQRKVSYGQYVAETRKSANMLAETGAELLRFLRYVKRGEVHKLPRDFRTLRKKTGDYLLQWEYGWKPLCSDIHGMFERSKESLQRPQIIKAVRQVPDHYTFEGTHHGQPFQGSVNHINKCVLYAQLADSVYYNAQNMQVNNPLAVGWELIPYSFVFDWFVPVGNYLDALTATAGLTFVAGYVSQSRQAHFNMKGTPCDTDVDKEVFIFQRNKLSSFPSGRIYANHSPFNTNRVKNALLLFNQRLR